MHKGLRIGIAQINSTVGDFPGNVKKILAAYRACLDQGADLVITPEMSLVGYPPRDLVDKSQFVPKCLLALDYLADEIKEVPLIVGYVDHNQNSGPGRPFRNAAAWLDEMMKQGIPTKNIIIHLNDSKTPIGSGIDQHEMLMEGLIWKSYIDSPKASGLYAFLDFSYKYQIHIILERRIRDELIHDYCLLKSI